MRSVSELSPLPLPGHPLILILSKHYIAHLKNNRIEPLSELVELHGAIAFSLDAPDYRNKFLVGGIKPIQFQKSIQIKVGY